MEKSTEKRQWARAPMDMPVQYSIDGQKWRETRSKDVSPTGIFLQSAEPVEPGQVLHLKFRLPNLRHVEPIEAKAEVMRLMVRQGRLAGFGLRFITLNASQYHVIEDFVRRILGLPLLEDFQKFGEQSTGGSYTFTIDRLAGEAAEKESPPGGRQMAVLSPAKGKNIWPRIRRSALIVAVFFILLILYNLGSGFWDLITKFMGIR